MLNPAPPTMAATKKTFVAIDDHIIHDAPESKSMQSSDQISSKIESKSDLVTYGSFASSQQKKPYTEYRNHNDYNSCDVNNGIISHSELNHLNRKQNENYKFTNYSTVWKKVKWPTIAVHLTFLVTFLMFPGIVSSIPSQYSFINKDSWMSVILITEFNLFDWVGRQFGIYFYFGFTSNTLWIGTLFRLFFLYPVFIAMYKQYVINDIIANVSVILLGLTNGYFCSLSFTFAGQCTSITEMEANGAIMSFGLVMGVFLGSSISTAISYIL